MEADNSFVVLMGRVRAGDEAAAAELVRLYEPAIRRAIRMRLTDPRLNRLVDSMDICQSVLANFFVRAAAGQFDLESPQQLLKLLATMARNKLLDHARKQQADRRDNRRVDSGSAEALEALPASQSTPSQIIAGRDLLEQVRARLSEEERYLADQRGLGREWAEIARELGAKPDALRMKLARGLDRIAPQLGLEEVPND